MAENMIKDYEFDKFENPYSSFKRSELGDKLAKFERLVNNLDIPVLIIIDGWESSGKGFVLNDLIRELDPRLHKVSVFENPTEEERERPFLWRFWKKTPAKGNMAVFDRSFYFNLMNDLNIDGEELKQAIADISSIEKELYEDGAIIVKFFLHQKEKTQKSRIDELRKDKHRSFLVTDEDEAQYKEYDKHLAHFDKILKLSNFDYSPWNIISTEDMKSASKKILGSTLDAIQDGIDRYIGIQNGGMRYIRQYIPEKRPLSNVDLSLSLSNEQYVSELKSLQEEAGKLAYTLYTHRIPTVIVFEGMDASGKGGSIKRLTRLMDPRGYEVIPIAAPDKTEKSHHYLWRFFNSVPKRGNMTIFDRSWYGRVMVERIEGFAEISEWDRAYDEINNMEKHLHNFGTLLLKFFIYIDKNEQLERFEGREHRSDKIYKITEEDWRNREKWDEYIEAMNEMLVRTSTEYAPWTIVEGKDKKYARIKVLKQFIESAKEAIANANKSL